MDLTFLGYTDMYADYEDAVSHMLLQDWNMIILYKRSGNN